MVLCNTVARRMVVSRVGRLKMKLVRMIEQSRVSLTLLVLVATTLAMSACTSRIRYEAPPLMPLPVEPITGIALSNAVPTRFVWQAARNTEYYEFHIYDRTTTDIQRYYRTPLRPSSVCGGELCSITITLAMPQDTGHAWRVRAFNNAGFSEWSRTIFSIVE